MGFSSKKSKTQSTSTVTPNNPAWVTDGVQAMTGTLQGLGGADPRSFVAPASPLQQQGFDLAGVLGAQAPGWLNSAAGTMQGLAGYQPRQTSALSVRPTEAFASLGAADPTSALSRLLSGRVDNPYLAGMHRANVNQSLQGYNDALGAATRALTRSALPGVRSGSILAGQYGGTRQGIAEGLALGDFGTQAAQNARNLAQSALDSGNQLYGGAYDGAQNRMATTANGLAGLSLENARANADRDLQAQLGDQSAGLQGANLNLDAAQALGAQGQYGVNTLGQFGSQQRDIAQQYAQAPLTTAQMLTNGYGALPYNLFQGNTTNASGTAKETGFSLSLDDISKAVKMGKSVLAASDPRLKRDVEPAGEDPQGRNLYAFNYLWDDTDAPPKVGYMADEVAQTDPDAVEVGPDGFAAVDYGRLARRNLAVAARRPAGLFGASRARWRTPRA